jgi:hypothetical protein
MANLQDLLEALKPLTDLIPTLSAKDPRAAERELEAKFAFSSWGMGRIRQLVREGVEQKWLCDRENGGVRYSRVVKATAPDGLSIDAVHMQGAAPGGHTHVNGEFDLCFAVDKGATFDGRDEGYIVYAPNTWHIPTVKDGRMDILYFLPGGGIKFGEQPADATPVGLQTPR